MPLSHLDAWTLHLQTNAIERSTARGYTTGARDYITFCKIHNLPFDPTPTTLARYIAFTSRHIKSGPKYLSGARHFLSQLYPDFDTNRAHPLVQATIRGSKKIRADPVLRKQPLRVQHLMTFLAAALQSNRYDDLLFIAILTSGFFGCHRLGELVPPTDRTLFDWRKVIKRSSVQFSKRRVEYHLPYHKTDPFFMGTHIILTSHEEFDPTTVLHLYAKRRDSTHGKRLVFFLREDGSHPTRSWFMSRLTSSLGHGYGGHSMRAGGATFFAGIGISEDVIQAIGRWSSQAWKIYIRDNPSIRMELQLARLHHRRLGISL